MNMLNYLIESLGNKYNVYNAINGKIMLKISDTGSGIKKEEIKKIFDIHYTTKDLGKGTGMGLFIVKDLLSRIKCEISVFSIYKKGTEVTINGL